MSYHNMHVKKYRNTERGFTLIEFLLYITLSVGMVLLLGGIGIAVLKSNLKGASLEEAHYDAEFALETIQRTTKGAEGIMSPEPGTASTTLILAMEEGSDPVSFRAVDGVLYMTQGEGVPEPVAGMHSNVSEITFHNVSTDMVRQAVRIEMTIAAQNPEDTSTEPAQSTYYVTSHVRY